MQATVLQVVIIVIYFQIIELDAGETEHELTEMFADMDNNIIAEAEMIADTQTSCTLLQRALSMVNSQNQHLQSGRPTSSIKKIITVNFIMEY